MSSELTAIGQNIVQMRVWSGRVPLLSLAVFSALIALQLGGRQTAEIEVATYHIASFILSGATNYYLHLVDEIERMGGYKKYLEERINQAAGSGVSLWENLYAVQGKNTIQIYYLVLIMSPIALSGYALYRSSTYIAVNFGTYSWEFFLAVAVWSIAVAFYGYSGLWLIMLQRRSDGREFERAYQTARSYHEEMVANAAGGT